jgi:hypothetical protein
MFTRLLYYGRAHFHMTEIEVRSMPFGLLLDLIACHMQYIGAEKPKHEAFIDDLIPL